MQLRPLLGRLADHTLRIPTSEHNMDNQPVLSWRWFKLITITPQNRGQIRPQQYTVTDQSNNTENGRNHGSRQVTLGFKKRVDILP